MGTILQITLANIKCKKFRTILIIISIVLSVSLLYTVLSMSSTVTKIFEQKIKKEVGNSELILRPDENAGEQYLKELSFDKIKGIAYHIPVINAYGFTKINDEAIPVSFTGMDYKAYQSIFPLTYTEKSTEGLTGNNLIIGKATAEKYNLAPGDDISVTIAGVAHEFRVSGIVEDQNNNLGYSLGNLKVLISQNTLSDILQLEKSVCSYYVKSSPDSSVKELTKALEKSYPKLKITDVTDMSEYKQMISMITSCLLLMVLAVIMVSTFIIYSSFKIIVIERMPLIGTLRSLGATKKTTRIILLLEAAFYGLIGGLLGCGLGILILIATLKLMFSGFGVTVENISYFNPEFVLIAFLLGLVLVIGSALLPVIKTSKKSIRSIIFTEIHNEKHFSVVKTFIGAIMIAIAFLLFNIAPIKLELTIDMFAILLVTIGGAMIIPLLSILLTKLLSLLLRPIFKDAFGVTIANVKNDRTMMNNILLLAMGLGVILMINNFSSAVGVTVSDVYSTGKSDALVFYNLDEAFVQKVAAVKDIEHVYATKALQNVSVNDGDITLPYVEGIDGRDYCKYAWDEFGVYLTDDIVKKLKGSRTILISKFLARKYDLKIGNELKLDFNETPITYQVIAVVPTIMNNGNMCFVYKDYLAKDSGITNYQSMYLNIKDTADTKEVLQAVKELMPNAILPIQTVPEMQEENIESNNVIFFMMKAISIIAMFIGIVGILNNFTISFLSRKKLIATMRSLGLSKSKTVRNMLFEAFICGCLGTLSGLVLGTILIKAMCYTIEAMGIPSDILFLNANDYFFVLISGILLSLLSAILPAISIAKENIVEGLRYE
jgi:putative ABC transport system permease protein